ncbi:MAG TPA: glucuronate isomerase, partial [Xanthomonadaceae bacterium]|nr:glucuronate isomerase [Xanthomonadaceae bacterium]
MKQTPHPLRLHPDRLFPADPAQRAIARRLYAEIAALPIVSPHGHTDPAWFAGNAAFANATELLLTPDHYVFRMLYSQGVDLDALGIPRADGSRAEVDPRAAWRTFAAHFHLFRGTPSASWLAHVFHEVFGLDVRLDAHSADACYDRISDALQTPAFAPRALFERFNIEVIATTESPLDPLLHHAAIRDSGWQGRVITAYRPDPVVDPEHEQFADALRRFGELSGEDVYDWQAYLRAHRQRRAAFARMGATSTDHGHPSAATADLPDAQARRLFDKVVRGQAGPADAELFRAQMLTEMAAMSVEDGLVMQLHPGCFRNHNQALFRRFGRDKGADIPLRTEYVHALKPLLDRFGNDPRFRLILFTLDESNYARELAPLA